MKESGQDLASHLERNQSHRARHDSVLALKFPVKKGDAKLRKIMEY
jgi:hypothetical protein